MDYLLEKDELNYLVLFNGLIGSYLQKKPVSEQLKVWDGVIFNELLINQPELNNEYLIFKEKFAKTRYKNTLFSEIFDEKIELKNAKHFLFNQAQEYSGDPENRFKLFIGLAQKTPEFSKLLHEAVNRNNGHDHYLFKAYFKNIKSIEPQAEVRENIKKFNTNSILKNEKKKLEAYLNLYKNQDLYEFILKDMTPAFLKSPLLLDYWESKLQLFPWVLRKDFNPPKLVVSPFTDKEEIAYKLTLNKEWVMSRFKLQSTVAGEFREIFYMGLSQSLSKKFKLAPGTISDESVRIVCASEDNLKEVKEFCHRLVPEINTLFQNYNFNNGPVKGAAEASELIDKFIFTDSLSEKLPSKLEVKPKTKI